MNSLPLVLANSMYVGKEQQWGERGTERGENVNQGNKIYYVRLLLNICTKYTTNSQIPFLTNSDQCLSDLSKQCSDLWKTAFKTLK